MLIANTTWVHILIELAEFSEAMNAFKRTLATIYLIKLELVLLSKTRKSKWDAKGLEKAPSVKPDYAKPRFNLGIALKVLS